MKRTIFSTLIFFTTTLVCFGQSDFREGYYISLENDTIYGLIDYRGEIKNSKHCVFKKEKSSPESTFEATDIKAYRFIDDKYYVSKNINTSRGAEQVFVEFLVNGIANLYFYRDYNNYLYLLEKEDGNILELLNEAETINIEGEGEVSINSNDHIRLLKASMADCMEIQPQIDQARLTHKSMIGITKNYHGYVCDDQQCIIYEKKLPAIKLMFAPVVGVNILSLKFKNGFYSRFEYEQITTPTYGGQLNIILPRVSERLTFQLEVIYSNSDFNGTYGDYYDLYINSGMLQSSLGIKYNFPKGKIRPTIATGIAMGSFMNSEFTAILNNDPTNPDQEHQLEDIYMAEQIYGAYAQIGCNYHLFKNTMMFTNIRYTMFSGSTLDISGKIKTIINSLNFSVGIYL